MSTQERIKGLEPSTALGAHPSLNRDSEGHAHQRLPLFLASRSLERLAVQPSALPEFSLEELVLRRPHAHLRLSTAEQRCDCS